MRISHSGRQTYSQCSEKYRLHYIEKLRGPKLASALFFGNALDDAFSRLLLDKKLLKTPEEEELLQFSAEEIFYKKMEQVKNDAGEIIEAAKSPFADYYYGTDFQPSLLTPKALSLLQEYAPDISDYPAFVESCKALIKSKKKVSQQDLPLLNYITWLTLVEKGLLMVDAYRVQVMPQIFEVYSIQEIVTILNADGDEITGKIDFTCSFVEEPGTMYVCDNKSSSKPYKATETAASAQLATYCEYKKTDKAAYVVIEKTVFKTAPIIRTTIIKDSIPEATFAHTFSEFENVIHSINTSAFEKNFKACFSYGRMCTFFALCKYNNAEGLICTKPKEVPVE